MRNTLMYFNYFEIVEAALIIITSEVGGVVILCLIKNVADFWKSPLSSTIQNQTIYWDYSYNLPLQNSKDLLYKSLAENE